MLVVIDQITGRPRGGFVGVDVFFVVSGYLITELLADEYAATRRISVLGFYRRRARRILPTALLVLAATWVAARLLFTASRAHQTAIEIYRSAAFGANIHAAGIDTDFPAHRPGSPVQHFWSLAVEEQFYLLWPLVLLLLLWAGRRLLRRRRQVLPITVSALMLVGLFALALWLTRRDSAAAYFATPARAWELAAGAVLALVLSTHARLPARLTGPVLGLGLVTVLASAFAVRADGHFPAPSAALPVAGALLVILAASTGRSSRSAAVLTNPVARYLGRLSYSLYLWHWPVIIFVRARLTGSRPYLDAVIIGLLGALTLLTHHFVEDPIRRHGLAGLRPRRAAARRTRAVGLSERGYVTVAAAACLLLSFIVWQAQPYRSARPDGSNLALAGHLPTATQRPNPSGKVVPPATLATAITKALDATRFPTLHPALSDLAAATVPEWQPCSSVDKAQLAGCTFPGATTSRKHRPVVVIGDSIGITWLPAVRGLQAAGYTVYGLTYSDCPAADIDVQPAARHGQRFTALCNAHRDWAINEVRVLHAGTVVLANSVKTIGRLADGKTGDAAFAQWQRATARTARRVQAAGAQRVVLLSPPPPAPDLQTCAASPSSTPGDCVSQLSDRWRGVVHAEAAAARQTGIVYVDVQLLFCSRSGRCPAFIGSTPVRVDGLHLTAAYSTRLAGVLDPIIAGSSP